MRPAWKALALALTPAIVLGCASGGERVRTATADVTLDRLQITSVLATGTNGYLYAGTSPAQRALYKFDAPSSVKHIADVPAYVGSFATTFQGDLYVGGTRCADSACSSSVNEVKRLSTDGSTLGTLVINRESSDPQESAGIGLLGTTSDALVIADVDGLVTLTSSGKVSPLAATGTYQQPCVIEDHLYNLSFPEEGGPVMLPAAGDDQSRSVTISLLDGGKSAPQDSGTAKFTLPAPLNILCTNGQFVAMSGHVAHQAWTPSSGWHEIQTEVAGAWVADALSSTKAWYRLDDAGVLGPSDPSALSTSLQFGAPVSGGPPPAVAVDDSGGSLFACLTPSPPVGSSSADADRTVVCKFATP